MFASAGRRPCDAVTNVAAIAQAAGAELQPAPTIPGNRVVSFVLLDDGWLRLELVDGRTPTIAPVSLATFFEHFGPYIHLPMGSRLRPGVRLYRRPVVGADGERTAIYTQAGQ